MGITGAMEKGSRAASAWAACILCGSPAEKRPFDSGGWEYHCSGRCPRFAVPGTLHYLLELENVFPPDLKRKISAYLIGLGLCPDVCHKLTKEDINSATGDQIL